MKLLSYDRAPSAPVDAEEKMRAILDELRTNRSTTFSYSWCAQRLFVGVRHSNGEVYVWSCEVLASAVAFDGRDGKE